MPHVFNENRAFPTNQILSFLQMGFKKYAVIVPVRMFGLSRVG